MINECEIIDVHILLNVCILCKQTGRRRSQGLKMPGNAWKVVAEERRGKWRQQDAESFVLKCCPRLLRKRYIYLP